MFRLSFQQSLPFLAVRCALPLILLLMVTRVSAQSPASVPVAPLHAGDIIRIKVWREPDLTGDVTVTTDGAAAIPRIGTIRVDTIATDSVRRLIVNTYAKWLVDPTIEVIFLRRLRVFGAVHNPGVYPVDAGLTVADAVALAGGVTQEGSYDNVRLMHAADRSAVRVTHVDRLADLGVQSGDEIFIPERSWLSRNSGTVVTSVITALAIVFGAILR